MGLRKMRNGLQKSSVAGYGDSRNGQLKESREVRETREMRKSGSPKNAEQHQIDAKRLRSPISKEKVLISPQKKETSKAHYL